MKRSAVVLLPNFLEEGKMSVEFSRGKGARFTQPYTVPTVCPQAWRTLLLQYLESMRPTDWLFPGGTMRFGRLVNLALRTVNPKFSVRALRRGALQAMARAGVPLKDCMTFSGHQRLNTLLQYLDLEAEAEERATAARAAAVHLAA